ncbi:MAG: hypothetical protein ACR2MO_06130 [Acidimicrobiales bacterium]
MTDPAGRPLLQELGGFYNLVIDGASVIMCLRHIASHVRDDGTTWRPRPVVLDDGTTWSPLPRPRNVAHDRAAAGFAAGLAATRVLDPPLAAAFGGERYLIPADAAALAPTWAERVLTAVAEGLDGLAIIVRWPELTGPVVRASVLYGATLAFQQQQAMSAALRADRAVATRDLGPEDRRRLDYFFERRSSCSMRDQWFEYHLDAWDRFTAAMTGTFGIRAATYTSDVAEYDNDVSHRDVLEHALSLLSAEGRALVEPFVAPADERFLAHTRAVDEPIWLRPEQRGDNGWWWFRVPLAVGGTFERQLREWPPPGGGAGER